MAKRLAHVLIAAALIPALVSCGSDSTTEPPIDIPEYPMTKDDVLVGLNLSYTQANLDEFAKLLADDFVFYFSPVDVAGGMVEVSQWDRESELMAAAGIFERPPASRSGAEQVGDGKGVTWGVLKEIFRDGPRDEVWVSKIALTLNFPQGDDTWEPIEPEGTNETLYGKTFAYLFTVVAGQTTFTSGKPIDAMIVVRATTIDGTSVWQIVEWYDEVW